MAGMSKAKAVKRLQELAYEGSRLRPQDGHSRRLQKWLQDVDNALYRIFGENSREYSRIPGGYTISHNGIRDHLQNIISLVESCLDDIRYFWEDNDVSQESYAERNMLPILDAEPVNGELDFSKVFVIHGHDEAARETLARFLEKLGLKPVILHEQPNEGRTIIEKFEGHTDVGFAIALLTPDDLGALKDKPNALKPRARQNVVFEFGYFIGKLGRNRVCALVKGDVERPSDYDGVVYIPLDNTGGWEMKLIRELKNAGADVDANQVI